MKLWVVEHFRVLPTSKEFKELTEDQIDLLFIHFLNRISDDDYKRLYHKNKTDTGLPKDQLKKMGYDDTDIVNIENELKNRG